MRTLPLLLAFASTLLLSLVGDVAQAQEGLPVRTIAEFSGFKVWDAAAALGGQRIYYTAAPDGQSDANALWLYDVEAGRSTQVASGSFMRIQSLAVSPAGDRLAFKRREEGGNAPQLWTLPLDPVTGLATGPAQRTSVSNAPGGRPAFSPDGTGIAFVRSPGGNERTLAVVPVGGGAERVLVEGELWVDDAVAWSPDGEWIHFFAWIGEEGAFRRVSATGGEPEVIDVPAGWGQIGLSPDGRLIAHWAPDFSSMVLSDAAARRLGTIAWADSWASPTELLTLHSNYRSGVKAVSLADGVVRDVLAPTDALYWTLAWAPDGGRFATMDDQDLLIVSADGSEVRRIPLNGDPASPVWSPDGRLIAITRLEPYGSTRPAASDGASPMDLLVVDAETGAIRTLPTAVTRVWGPRWTSDSERIRYVHQPFARGEGPTRAQVREIGLDGSDTLVSELTLASERSTVRLVSDTTLTLVVDSLTYVHSLTTGRSVQIFDEPPGTPSVSPSGNLVAVRPPGFPRGSGPTSALVLTPSGDTVSAFDLGMFLGPGVSGGFIFTPDERHLITHGGEGGGECCRIVVAPIDGGPVRTLVHLPDHGPRGRGRPRLALSPDGKTLLFTYGGELATHIGLFDVSPLVPQPERR